MTHSFQALGTTWWIEVFTETDSKTLDAAFGSVEGFCADFENRYSRFKPDSFVSKLNQDRELIDPSAELRALLQFGKDLYLRTNTHFNILSGHILEIRGYDAVYSFQANDESTLNVGNPITDLLISQERITLTQGSVDIGGFGKGYLIDLVANLLREQFALQYFLINAGGDMFGTSDHDMPIEIQLEHPVLERTIIAKTTLHDQGFAASSPYKRRWKHRGKTYTHLVSDSITHHASYVKHHKAATADAFATTALLAQKSEMEQISQTEHLALAYFDPTTNQLTGNKLFFTESSR